jgi:hypothetical protein
MARLADCLKKAINPQTGESLLSQADFDELARSADHIQKLGYTPEEADALAIEAQLKDVRKKITSLRGELASQGHDVTPKTVDTTVQEKVTVAKELPDGVLAAETRREFAQKRMAEIAAAEAPALAELKARVSAALAAARLRVTPEVEKQALDRYKMRLNRAANGLTDDVKNLLMQGEGSADADAVDAVVSQLLAEDNIQVLNAGPKGLVDLRQFRPQADGSMIANPVTIVKLFESRDFSTMVHEGAHMYFNTIQRMVADGLANEELVKDYEFLVEWMGGTTRAGLEKFARGHEAWYMTGKAPSIRLMRSFSQFTKWLLAIYKNLAGLSTAAGQEINMTEDVRARFDRMFASQAEMDEVRKLYDPEMQDVWGSLPAEEQKILKTHKDAEEMDAEAKNLSKYMTAYLEATGGKQAVREEATDEIDADPMYDTLNRIKEAGGIRTADVPRDLATAIAEAHGKVMISAKGGADLGSAAVQAGFADTHEFLVHLSAIMPRKMAIDTLAAQKLAAIEADIRASIAPSEATPGEESLHTESRMAYLIAQNQILDGKIELAKRARAGKIQEQVLKDGAEAHIASLPASEAANYSNFARAGLRAGRDALKALRDGDAAAAAAFRTQQLKNHALVMASIKAREAQRKIGNNLRKQAGSKTMIHQFNEQVRALVTRYGLGTKSLQPKFPDELPPLSQLVSPDTGEPVALQAAIPEWILAGVNSGENADKLTHGQLVELNDAVNWIAKRGRSATEAKELGKAQELEEWDKLFRERAESLPNKTQANEEATYKTKGLKFWRWVSALTTQFRFALIRLDGGTPLLAGGKTDGPFYRIQTALDRCATRESQLWRTHKEKLNKALAVIDAAVTRLKKEHGEYFGAKEVPGLPNTTPEMQEQGQFRWTPERLVTLLLNLGNNGNAQAIVAGYALDDSHIDAISRLFLKKELQGVQDIWDFLESVKPEVAATFERIEGVPFTEVKAQPMILNGKDGPLEMDGGYYPLVLDTSISTDAFNKADREEIDIMGREASVSRMYGPQSRFVKVRKGTKLPPRLDLSVLMTHLRDSFHYAAFAETIRDVDRITQTKGFQQAMESKESQELYREVRPWLKRIARPQSVKPVGGVESKLDWQKRLATTVLLGWNFMTALKQAPGILQSIPKVGFLPLAKAVYRTVLASPVEVMRGAALGKHPIYDLSVYMEDRRDRVNQAIADRISRTKPHAGVISVGDTKFSWRDVQDFGLMGIRIMDQLTVLPVWQAAYDKHFEETADVAASVEAADEVIRQTQPDAAAADLSKIQGSDNMARYFVMFMTPALKIGNQMGTFYRVWRDKKMSNKEFFASMWWLAIAPPIATALLTGVARGEPPDEEELLFAELEWLTQGLPGVGSGIRALRGENAGSLGDSPVFEGLDRLKEAGSKFSKAIESDDPEAWSRAAWGAGSILEWASGVPAVRLTKNAMQGLQDLEEGNTKNPLRLLFKPKKRKQEDD